MNPETSHGKHLETVAAAPKCHRVAVCVDAGDQKCPGVVGRPWAVESESSVQRGSGGAPLSEVGMDGAWSWV